MHHKEAEVRQSHVMLERGRRTAQGTLCPEREAPSLRRLMRHASKVLRPLSLWCRLGNGCRFNAAPVDEGVVPCRLCARQAHQGVAARKGVQGPLSPRLDNILVLLPNHMQQSPFPHPDASPSTSQASHRAPPSVRVPVCARCGLWVW